VATHLSLSGEARLRSAQRLLEWLAPADGDVPAVLAGDFNAEIGEDSLRLLTAADDLGMAQQAQQKQQPESRPNRSASFVDTWSHLSAPESGSQCGRVDSEVGLDGSAAHTLPSRPSPSVETDAGLGPGLPCGLTFPTCDPVKRIDFILARNATRTGGAVLWPTASFLVGDQPNARTADLRFAPFLLFHPSQTRWLFLFSSWPSPPLKYQRHSGAIQTLDSLPSGP
jgi:endonuclease/exonuclease/phosphatase family metal-dependent hydrolase